MTTRAPELDEFLAVVGQVLGGHAADADPGALDAALADADILALGLETAELDDALLWVTEVVVTAARVDASVGYALAGRYAAQRALLAGGAGTPSDFLDVTSVLAPVIDGPVTVTYATRFTPSRLLVVDPVTGTAAWGTVPTDGVPSCRTGLVGALLHDGTVPVGTTTMLSDGVAASAGREWTVLTAAASVGTAEAAVAAAQSYATVRRQFGAALESFAGLRAIVSDMEVKARAARALLDHALDTPGDPGAHLALAATAGRAAVDIAVDAIQVHGGYGYIDEYPVAGLLRDALSLRARGLPRRSGLAGLADARLGAGA